MHENLGHLVRYLPNIDEKRPFMDKLGLLGLLLLKK